MDGPEWIQYSQKALYMYTYVQHRTQSILLRAWVRVWVGENVPGINTAARRLHMRKFVAVILLLKKGYENYEGNISEYVTMLTMKPCTDYLP